MKISQNKIAFLCFILLTSCATRRLPRSTNTCATAPALLREAWNTLQDKRSAGGGCKGDSEVQCEQIRLEISRLGQNCPGDQQALLANAILAYDERQWAKAQQLLDRLLASSQPNAEAAALRARVAIEEGNLPYALRFLSDQIRLTGDHAGLREVYASALFLHGDHQQASDQLAFAAKLGAPEWRVEYGRGLIAEALGQWDAARQHFEAAVAVRPDWNMPKSRLRALGAR